jgi:hypothetical protein
MHALVTWGSKRGGAGGVSAAHAPSGMGARHLAARRVLLLCGILSALVYVAANVACSMAWKQYSSFSQTISELSAIDAPSRSVWIAFAIPYDLLLAAFGAGVWLSARGRRGLRVSAALLVAMAAMIYWPPMHMRGSVATATDTLHIVWTSAASLIILLAIGFAATAFGKRWRLYSIATLVMLVAAGTATFLYAPRLAANLPTPGMGALERIDLGAYLLWVALLAITLRRERPPVNSGGRVRLAGRRHGSLRRGHAHDVADMGRVLDLVQEEVGDVAPAHRRYPAGPGRQVIVSDGISPGHGAVRQARGPDDCPVETARSHDAFHRR